MNDVSWNTLIWGYWAMHLTSDTEHDPRDHHHIIHYPQAAVACSVIHQEGASNTLRIAFFIHSPLSAVSASHDAHPVHG